MSLAYRREIDGLRAIAVLSVILFHGGSQAFSGGFVGVDVFFVISGYLITSIILSEKKAGTFSIVNFYERRARRILPALFFMMILSVPFAWLWLLPQDLKDFGESLLYVPVFFSNTLFYNQSGYFDTAAELKPLLHTWSLAVEEQYYLLFPVFMLALWKWARRFIPYALLLAALASLVYAHYKTGVKPDAAFFLLPSRIWELLAGAMLAYYSLEKSDSGRNARIDEIGSLVGLLLVAYAIFGFDKSVPFPGLYALVPTIGAVLIIRFATPATFAGKLLGAKVLVFIGFISYSAYLWHQPLFALARHGGFDGPGLFIGLSVAVIALAYLSWRFIEQPFRNKSLFNRRTVFLLGSGFSVSFIALGGFILLNDGLLYRFSGPDRYLATIDNKAQGEYVVARFDSLKLKPFSSTGKKVVVIGDSFAQDLVNAVFESDLKERLAISTFHIDVACGNLYLTEDFSSHIEKKDRNMCAKHLGYKDETLRARMREADEIWLSSSWRDWQAMLVAESVENIEKEFSRKVVVFGRKNFGEVSSRRLIRMPVEDRLKVRSEMTSKHIEINRLMKEQLPPDLFIDVSQMFCGADDACDIFNNEGKLISYDGGHLTPDGAKVFGEKLLQYPRIRRFAGI